MGFTLDTDRIELRDGDSPVHLEPQVFDLLVMLIEHRDRVVTKRELLEEVWGDTFVSESALTSRVKSARQALGDSGRAQRVIRTVHGRGYQFIAEVTERTGEEEARPSTDHPGEVTDSPTGTVTFLFSDIERSSAMWEQHPEQMALAIPRHDELLRSAIETHRGTVFATGGDGVAAAFGRAADAVGAAEQIRRTLDAERWPTPVSIRVRLGLHTGEALERNGDYLGAAVNRAARVAAAANGGQTLLSDVTSELLADRDDLVDLGICLVDPAMPPMRLWQLGSAAFPPLAGAVAAAPPLLRTELIGRDAELERVADLTAQGRLVSITGPGGAGKTTLALAAANAELASFSAGVAFVELAAVGDAAGLTQAVAEAAGIQGVAAVDQEGLAEHLAGRSVLLVLDNCEHLLDECGDFVDLVLDRGSEAHVLVTSREPLGVDGETVLPLSSLAADAPELFVTRARSLAPQLEISVDDPRVVDICGHLDGLPLAVELAAAQLRALGLDDLLERIDQSLDLASTGRSRGRERHVTLDRTIAWSYDLLDGEAQHLLRQLGAFPASFDLAAADAVAGTEGSASVLAPLMDLVTKSLLVRHADSGRFRLLETIRAFALRRADEAGELEDARDRLRAFVVEHTASTSRVDRWLSGAHAVSFRADLENARFAFERSIAQRIPHDALEVLIGGGFLWRNTLNCIDGRRWIAQLEDFEEGLDPIDRVWMALERADLGQGTADHGAMQQAAESAVARARDAGDDGALAIALHFEALPYIVAAPEEAVGRLGEAQTAAASFGDARLTKLVDAFAVMAALAGGEIDRGVEMTDRFDELTGDGYEVFITNWVGWMVGLVSEDLGRLRFWTDQQRLYLSTIGLMETWLTMWSMSLSSAMEGEDVHDRLHRARLRADREGLESASDAVLALALIARREDRPHDAAELLGTITGLPLNNAAHYVLFRTLRRSLQTELDADELRSAMERGAGTDPESVLVEAGLSTTSP